VTKLYTIKKRDEKKMFSIIAPSFDRIITNYQLREANLAKQITIELLQKYLNTYHGVTYIFTYDRPGVRIIKHPFQAFVEKLGESFITTSCNVS